MVHDGRARGDGDDGHGQHADGGGAEDDETGDHRHCTDRHGVHEPLELGRLVAPGPAEPKYDADHPGELERRICSGTDERPEVSGRVVTADAQWMRNRQRVVGVIDRPQRRHDREDCSDGQHDRDDDLPSCRGQPAVGERHDGDPYQHQDQGQRPHADPRDPLDGGQRAAPIADTKTVLATEEHECVRDARSEEQPRFSVAGTTAQDEDTDAREPGSDEPVVQVLCVTAETKACADQRRRQQTQRGGYGRPSRHPGSTTAANDWADSSALVMNPAAPDRSTRSP